MVPRQVRDYVRTLISPHEKLEIVQRSADLFFGSKWREGRITIRPEIRISRAFGDASRLDNEHTITCHLLLDAIKRQDDSDLKRSARLGVAYCTALVQYDRFRDAVYSTEELLHLLDNTNLRKEVADLIWIRGDALRMVGRHVDSLELLQKVLNDYQDVITNKDKAGIYMLIALLHFAGSDKVEAAKAAKTTRQLSEKGTSRYIHATAIIYECELSGDELRSKLEQLEKQARNKGFHTVANNIALSLAGMTVSLDAKLALQNRVINSVEDPYNRIRASVRKAECLMNVKRIAELTPLDRRVLSMGYSYLHAQRFGSLFNDCHAAIWQLLQIENKLVQLLRLFRHSSFLWRLRGQQGTEKKYLSQLEKVDLTNLGGKSTRNSVFIEIQYLDVRRSEQESNSKDEELQPDDRLVK